MGCSFSVRRPNIRASKYVRDLTYQSRPENVSIVAEKQRRHSVETHDIAEGNNLNQKGGSTIKLKVSSTKRLESQRLPLNLLNLTSELTETKENAVQAPEFLRQFSNGNMLSNLTSAISFKADYIPTPEQAKGSQTSNLAEIVDLLEDVTVHSHSQVSINEYLNIKAQLFCLEDNDFPVYQMFEEIIASPPNY